MALEIRVELDDDFKEEEIVSVLCGEELNYGVFAHDKTKVNEFNPADFIVFNAEYPGRGIRASFFENFLYLFLRFPSTEQDIKYLWNAVNRLMKNAGKKMTIDERAVTLEQFNKYYEPLQKNNLKFITQLKDSPEERIIMYGVHFPIEIDKKQMSGFSENPESFSDYFVALQSEDYYYAAPLIYKKGSDYYAVYIISKGVDSLISKDKSLTSEYFDIDTQKFAVEIKDWYVFAVEWKGDEPEEIVVDKEEFLKHYPKNKKFDYSFNLYCLEGLDDEEWKNLLSQLTPIDFL